MFEEDDFFYGNKDGRWSSSCCSGRQLLDFFLDGARGSYYSKGVRLNYCILSLNLVFGRDDAYPRVVAIGDRLHFVEHFAVDFHIQNN